MPRRIGNHPFCGGVLCCRKTRPPPDSAAGKRPLCVLYQSCTGLRLVGLPEGDPLGQAQGLQPLRAGRQGRRPVRYHPPHRDAASASSKSTASRTRRGCFFFWGRGLAPPCERGFGGWFWAACPAGRKPVPSACGRPAAARRIMSSSQRRGVVRCGDRAEPAALFRTEHQHMVALPLGAGHSQLCAHDAAGRLRPGKGQTDRVRACPPPRRAWPGHAFRSGGRPWRRRSSWCRSRRPSRRRAPSRAGTSSSAPAAASPQASRRSWASSACTAAAARLVSPAPYTSAPKLLRRLWAAFFSPRGRVCMDSQQRLCAPALPLGLCPPLGRKPRHRSCQPSLRRTVQAQHTAGLLCQIPSTPYYDVSRTNSPVQRGQRRVVRLPGGGEGLRPFGDFALRQSQTPAPVPPVRPGHAPAHGRAGRRRAF